MRELNEVIAPNEASDVRDAGVALEKMLGVMADFRARFGEHRPRIIGSPPFFPQDSAFKFAPRNILFLGSGVIDAIRPLAAPSALDLTFGSPTLVGIEIEPWESRDDHRDIMREMLVAMGATLDLALLTPSAVDAPSRSDSIGGAPE